MLYRAVVLSDDSEIVRKDSALNDTNRSPIIALARTLIARSELQQHLKVLKLDIPLRSRIHGGPDPNFRMRPLPSTLLAAFCGIINDSPFPEDVKKNWRISLEHRLELSSCGVLLMLVPRLQYLALAGKHHGDIAFFFGVCLGIAVEKLYHTVSPRFDRVPSLTGLKHLRLRGTMPPIGASQLLGLDTVELWASDGDMKLPVRWKAGSNDPTESQLPHPQSFLGVHTLRHNCYFANLRAQYKQNNWIPALYRTFTYCPALKHLHLISSTDQRDVNMHKEELLEIALIVEPIAAQCMGLVSLEIQSGPWKHDSRDLYLHHFVKMERLVLPEKVLVMLAGARMPPNLKHLEITDRFVGSAGKKWEDLFEGRDFEVVVRE